MRIPFGRLFEIVGGQIVPQADMIIDSLPITAGIPIDPTLKIAGTEIQELTNCELAFEIKGGLFIIIGFHPPES